MPVQVALTDEQLEKMAVPSGELIAVEGTKLKISRKLYSHAEMIKKNALRHVFAFLQLFFFSILFASAIGNFPILFHSLFFTTFNNSFIILTWLKDNRTNK